MARRKTSNFITKAAVFTLVFAVVMKFGSQALVLFACYTAFKLIRKL
jgi:hypothetical protein